MPASTARAAARRLSPAAEPEVDAEARAIVAVVMSLSTCAVPASSVNAVIGSPPGRVLDGNVLKSYWTVQYHLLVNPSKPGRAPVLSAEKRRAMMEVATR